MATKRSRGGTDPVVDEREALVDGIRWAMSIPYKPDMTDEQFIVLHRASIEVARPYRGIDVLAAKMFLAAMGDGAPGVSARKQLIETMPPPKPADTAAKILVPYPIDKLPTVAEWEVVVQDYLTSPKGSS